MPLKYQLVWIFISDGAVVLRCCRYPPFYDQDTTNTYKKIVSGHFTFPTGFPVAARDLVRKLLQVMRIPDIIAASIDMTA